ncbi:hypothetical protein HDE_01335 [Halotydeus destructor]|nr:hypothetical protein HDE_01335 [Halotydeus destructor]
MSATQVASTSLEEDNLPFTDRLEKPLEYMLHVMIVVQLLFAIWFLRTHGDEFYIERKFIINFVIAVALVLFYGIIKKRLIVISLIYVLIVALDFLFILLIALYYWLYEHQQCGSILATYYSGFLFFVLETIVLHEYLKKVDHWRREELLLPSQRHSSIEQA